MAGTFHTASAVLQENIGATVAITAAATHGAATDTLNFRRAFALFYSLPTGSGTTADCYIEECATSGGSYVKVPSSDFTQATTVGGAQLQMLNIDLAKRLRYLKVVMTGAGGSAAGVMTALIVLAEPGYAEPSHVTAAVTV